MKSNTDDGATGGLSRTQLAIRIDSHSGPLVRESFPATIIPNPNRMPRFGRLQPGPDAGMKRSCYLTGNASGVCPESGMKIDVALVRA